VARAVTAELAALPVTAVTAAIAALVVTVDQPELVDTLVTEVTAAMEVSSRPATQSQLLISRTM
jgi:hypothetical protein